jgi:hypothetical protein
VGARRLEAPPAWAVAGPSYQECLDLGDHLLGCVAEIEPRAPMASERTASVFLQHGLCPAGERIEGGMVAATGEAGQPDDSGTGAGGDSWLHDDLLVRAAPAARGSGGRSLRQ